MHANESVVIHRDEYARLREEHELLAVLRSYGIEEWEYWDKAVKIIQEGKKNGYR